MRSTLHRRRLFTSLFAPFFAPLFAATLALSSACVSYEVVDYPSALDETPDSLWISWDYTQLRIGKKSEAEWLASRKREVVRERHAELKEELALGYIVELDTRLGGWVELDEGLAPGEGLQLDVVVENWIEGIYVPAVDPALAVSVPTIVEARVDFILGGQLMESIAIKCAVDARLWSIDAHHRFEQCGDQLGKATSKYINDRVGS